MSRPESTPGVRPSLEGLKNTRNIVNGRHVSPANNNPKVIPPRPNPGGRPTSNPAPELPDAADYSVIPDKDFEHPSHNQGKSSGNRP